MIPRFFVWLFGPSWKTTVSSAGTAIFGFIAFIASLPYTLGEISTVFPVAWKPYLTVVFGLAAAITHFVNGREQKGKEVTGGSVKQSTDATTVVARVENPSPSQATPVFTPEPPKQP